MKRLSNWMLYLLALIFIILPMSISYAQDKTPVSDDEVNRVAREMYCPVCENIPLDVCPTRACAQWRELIREKLGLGWSDQQIKDFFAASYGDQVLGVPPARGLNWLIYILPLLVLLAGVFIVVSVIRSSKKSTPPAQAVNPAEKPAAPEEIVNEIEKELRRIE